jgi:hypothetical protein
MYSSFFPVVAGLPLNYLQVANNIHYLISFFDINVLVERNKFVRGWATNYIDSF